MSVSSSFSLGSKISSEIKSPAAYDLTSGSKQNIPQTQRSDLYSAYLNKPKEAAYRWTETNPVTDGYPRLVDARGQRLNIDLGLPNSSSTITEGVFYENGSYFKLGAVTLSYSVPDKFTRSLGLTSLGAAITGSNLFMITNYSGLNPETPGAVYPISRSFSFTINIGL